MNKVLRLGRRKGLIILGGVLLLFLGIFTIPKIFASLQPIESIEIYSKELDYNDSVPGSWKIKKSAKWLSKNTAEISFDLDTILKKEGKAKDYLFVLDVSSSMEGDRINRVKSDASQLIENLLASKDTEIGLITFSTESEILSEFTDDKNGLINKINNLTTFGSTNYYQALVNVENILKEMERKSNNDCVVLFLTDGYPNVETSNEIWQYQYLKQQYPSLIINAIQYEMGDSVLLPLKNISDNQYIAKIDTLNNVLFDAAVDSVLYDNFKITDFIDTNYFSVDSNDDIEVDYGDFDFNLKEQSIVWNLDGLKSGFSAKMKIKVRIKDEFKNTGGNYPTNKKVDVSNNIDNIEDKIVSSLTPVLSNNYKVTYDGNVPKGCSINNVPKEKNHFVFDVVEISKVSLSCSGYQFKGWDIVNNDVTMINSDYFTVPENDVILRAKWSKLKIEKAVDGKVFERVTLYDQVKSDVDDSSKFAMEYTKDTSTFIGKNKVYYYRGSNINNNVYFADFCWKIVRTTETGGVKLVYNGVPDFDGSCDNSDSLAALTKEQMGTTTSTVPFNNDNQSPATVGYMYNTSFDRYSKSADYDDKIIRSTAMTDDTEYYYFDDISYRSDYNAYYIPSKKLYKWGESKNELVGKYTCAIGADHSYFDLCRKVYYVVDVFDDEMYIMFFDDGKLMDEKKMAMSSEVNKNEDGTFTLVNPTVMNRVDWYRDYDNYSDYYTCGTTDTTCTDMRHITNVDFWYYDYSVNYKFGKSFSYEDGKYTLTDTEDYWSEQSSFDAIDERRYTCFNTTGQCDSISYVYYINQNDMNFYYFNLENGQSAREALISMLYSPTVNTNNSSIKNAIDYWYQNNMIEYTSYLEDTIWCNNRTTRVGTWGDAEPLNGSLRFKAGLTSDTLKCDNEGDRFTVNKENGNGKLTYPVGLITAYEADQAFSNNTSPLASGSRYWTISPLSFTNASQSIAVQKSGNIQTSFVTDEHGVRPAVSLKTGIRYSYGDGSKEHPYVIETIGVS